MSRRFQAFPLMAAGVLAAASATPAFAETAEEILEAAMSRYEKRLETIESVTIVQEVMGQEATERFEKRVVDGHAALVPVREGDGDGPASLYGQFDELAKDASLEGKEEVDGHSCWVIRSDRLAEMDLTPGGSNDFVPTEGRFYLDREELTMRRLVMSGTAERDGVRAPVTMETRFSDFREIDGWLQPFRTEIALGGGGGDEEMPEMAEMREGLAKMKEELEKMPPEQRRMVEEMMKGQMAQLEKMAESGRLEISITVKEVRVNEAAE